METLKIKAQKNKHAVMFFSVIVFLGLSFYLYITKMDVTIHDDVLLWGESESIQDFWGYLSRMGQEWFQILVCVFFGVYYYKKCNYRLSRLWYGSIAVYLIVGIFAQILKFTVGRPRPKLLPDYDFAWFEMAARLHSWPSGHTITTFAWLACLLPFYGKKVQIILIALACLIGFSRVGLGSHYMSDVLSGAVLGYVVGVLLREKFKLGVKA